jgi:tol-pal system protein YbgF
MSGLPSRLWPFRLTQFQTPMLSLAAMVIGSAVMMTVPVLAQQTPSANGPPPAGAGKPAKVAAAKPKTESGTAPGAQTESALRQRVETLEEQLVDMQVVVGTLESFAKSSGAASASPTYRAGGASDAPATSGVDQARVSGLEAQVRSLTAQVQQLSELVRTQSASGNNGRRSESTPPVSSGGGGFGTATVSAAKPDHAKPDSIESVLAASGQGGENGSVIPAAASPNDGGNAKAQYETAYNYLLQQDYGAAETAFDDFLKRYPSDGLAGSAQFWLGESFFVRGQYKPAASAFLKGYQTYGRSSKAPDSLLKLAMSLGRMGQKDAACSSFGELATRFPAASADVKSRAQTEKQRSGCP